MASLGSEVSDGELGEEHLCNAKGGDDLLWIADNLPVKIFVKLLNMSAIDWQECDTLLTWLEFLWSY